MKICLYIYNTGDINDLSFIINKTDYALVHFEKEGELSKSTITIEMAYGANPYIEL